MTVYRRPLTNEPLALLGRYRCHTKPILQILFGLDPEGNTTLLYSLGKDRRLCEFNLSASSLAEGLRLSSRVALEQRSQPTAMALLPTCGEEQFIMTASRANKLRLLNSATKMCRHVVMGPRVAEAAAAKILPLPLNHRAAATINAGSARRPVYGLLLCGRDVVMSRLPPSGAAHAYSTKQTCAERADDLAATHDGSGCFVLSRGEECVVQLAIDPTAYEDTLTEEGSGEAGLARLLEDPEARQLYEELKDYFSLVQLEEGGKELRTEVPLEAMERICRGLGYFPTEREVEDMVNEVFNGAFHNNITGLSWTDSN